MMERKKIRMAFAGIKGGAGKSTLAIFLGVMIREQFDKKICFVDCDFNNNSILGQAKQEQQFYEKHKDLVERMLSARDDKVKYTEPIPVERLDDITEEGMSKIEAKYPDVDIFIYDTKGSAGEIPFLKSLTSMDYVFQPVILDNLNARPSYIWLRSMRYVLDQMEDKVRMKGVYLLFNMQDNKVAKEQDATFEWWDTTAKDLGTNVVKNRVPANALVGKSLYDITKENQAYFTSISIAPPKSSLMTLRIEALVNEVYSIISGETKPQKARKRRVIDRDKLVNSSQVIEKTNEMIATLEKIVSRSKNRTMSTSQMNSFLEWVDTSMEQLKMYFGDDPTLTQLMEIQGTSEPKEEPKVAVPQVVKEEEGRDIGDRGEDVSSESPSKNIEESNVLDLSGLNEEQRVEIEKFIRFVKSDSSSK